MSRTALPQAGLSWDQIETQMRERAAGDVKWREGKTAVYVFNAGEEVERVQKTAYAMFSAENGLGPMAFPSLMQMERDVVDFGLSLLNAPEGAAGSMTSGGTDSITMAVKAARNLARSQSKSGVLNLVLPFSAHPAFDKAAELMELDVRRTPVKDYRADPAAMADAIDDNTIMIVGSAPSFPFGVIDPISDLSDLAQKRGVWLHVDACVGGYLAPFVRMNGADLPVFDFSAPGVQSMSADLHKYGYCSKGASTVFFRTGALRDHMTFDAGPWPLGRMVTPTLSGTRPGGAIASAWAVMNFLGVDGYREKQGLVVQAREKIEAGVKKLGFHVYGQPQLGILAFAHERENAFTLLRRMHARGWVSAALADPPALHVMLSPIHARVGDQYLADLEASLQGDAPESAMPSYAG